MKEKFNNSLFFFLGEIVEFVLSPAISSYLLAAIIIGIST